jgi:predicted alpha-1,2-mannosidase
MVVVSPDTYPAIRGDFHNGYNYDDKELVGFSHLRMEGVGCTGLGGHLSLLPLPSAPRSLDPASYAQQMEKRTEKGSPNYYAVTLSPSGIRTELTTTRHASLQRYGFPAGKSNVILVDLGRGLSPVLAAEVEQISDHRIVGSFTGSMMCSQKGFYKIYFDLEVQKPLLSVESLRPDRHKALAKLAGTDIVLGLNLPPNEASESVVVKIGFSTVDVADATAWLHKEVPAWDFDAARREGEADWNRELSRITLETSAAEEKLFYTTFYHALLLPALVAEKGSRYRGSDGEVHTVVDHDFYSSWSLWDTYRTQMPLNALLNTQRGADFCESLSDVFKQRYAEQAVGYWPVPSIRLEGAEQMLLDFKRKGICPALDEATYVAVRDALRSRISERRGALAYEPYSPGRKITVARTLDDDYAAWAVSRWAELLGHEEDARKFAEIALGYKSLWNPSTRLFAGKDAAGHWVPSKTPDKIDDVMFYEGSARQYRWVVPYDLPGLIHLFGGKEQFNAELNELFQEHRFNIANEPDINYPYLFIYSGEPWLAQKHVHDFVTTKQLQLYASHDFYKKPVFEYAFRDTPDALLPEMDDDAGTMSAWYILGAIGLYQPIVGSPYYVITTPALRHSELHLSEGKTFQIDVKGDPIKSRYIQSATLNGKGLQRAWLRDSEVRGGGTLVLVVGDKPNKEWGLEPVPE